MTRSQQRFATASAAILVQILLVLLFANSFMPGKRQEVAREMMLLLRPIFRPQAATRAPERPLPRMIAPPAVLAPPIFGDRAVGVVPAPPSTLEGIGRALFGCSPEHYGQLPREEQARCPPPGEGLARRPPDADLLYPPKSRSRDAVMWAEDRAAREFAPDCIGLAGGSGADCMMRQTLAERKRAKQARAEYEFERTRRNAPPPPPKPLWVGAGPPKR